jgi:hypothetical protein
MLQNGGFLSPDLIPINMIELEVFEAGRQNAGNPIVLCHGWPDLLLLGDIKFLR